MEGEEVENLPSESEEIRDPKKKKESWRGWKLWEEPRGSEKKRNRAHNEIVATPPFQILNSLNLSFRNYAPHAFRSLPPAQRPPHPSSLPSLPLPSYSTPLSKDVSGYG